MNKAIICDLDGVIADTDSLEQVCMQSGTWDQGLFVEECGNVYPDNHFLEVLYQIRAISKAKLYIVTARPIELENETLNWLTRNNVQYSGIYMNTGKYGSVKFKEKAAQELMKEYDITLAIDDKSNYIDMYKKLGIQTWHYTNNTRFKELTE